MSDPPQQPPRRGEALRPTLLVPGGDGSRSHSFSQAPVPSIENLPDPSQRQSSSSTSQSHSQSHTPHTPHSAASQPLFRVPQSPHSLPGEPSHKSAKIAIPRLKRSTDPTGADASRSGGRHRVNHACEPCRHRKTKCSGERPVCRHCEDFKIACFYADGKRDRVKK
jgi:hypothetical protein